MLAFRKHRKEGGRNIAPAELIERLLPAVLVRRIDEDLQELEIGAPAYGAEGFSGGPSNLPVPVGKLPFEGRHALLLFHAAERAGCVQSHYPVPVCQGSFETGHGFNTPYPAQPLCGLCPYILFRV